MIFLIVAVSTLLYGAVHQAVLALTYLSVASMLMIWAIDCYRKGAFRYSSEPTQLILFASALYGLVQVVPIGAMPAVGGIEGISKTVSLDPFATQVNALHFFALAIFFSLVCVSLDSANRVKRVAVFITVFGSVYAFYAILQSILSPNKIYGLLERSYALPFGSFISRNNFAAWMEMAVAIPLGMLFTKSVATDKRIIVLTAAIIMGVSIVLSGSRGGLITLLLQLLFLTFITYSRDKRSSPVLKIALSIGILAAIIGGTVFVGGENTLKRIGEEQAVAEGTVTRPQIWAVTLKMITANMPFGVGLGAYGVAYTQYDDASGLERVEQAHNDYLQVLSDAGIVGGVLGLLFLYFVFAKGIRAIRTSNGERRGIAVGAFTGAFGVLVHSLFDFVLHTTAVALLFLTLLGLLAAAASHYPDDAVDRDHPRRKRRTKVPVNA